MKTSISAVFVIYLATMDLIFVSHAIIRIDEIINYGDFRGMLESDFPNVNYHIRSDIYEFNGFISSFLIIISKIFI